MRQLDRKFLDDSTKRLRAVWHGQETTLLPDLVTEDRVDRPALAERARGVAGMTGTHLGDLSPGYAPTGRRIDVERIDVYDPRDHRPAKDRTL